MEAPEDPMHTPLGPLRCPQSEQTVQAKVLSQDNPGCYAKKAQVPINAVQKVFVLVWFRMLLRAWLLL